MADLGSLGGLADTVLHPAGQQAAQTASSGGGWSAVLILILIFVVIAVVATVTAVVWFFWSEKKKWQITTRVHYENPTIDGVNIGNGVPTKRVRFKDGKVVYMYKTPIQGYTISPELLTWSRPREHDVIVTQDKKLFCLVGINSIDTQRKKLNVDVSYPDIEMDRQDLQKHIDSKKFDDPNEKFKLIAKIAIWVFICITVIVGMVVGGKYYIDGKNINAQTSANNVKVAQLQQVTIQDMNTFVLILSKVMPQSFQSIDGQNLLRELNATGAQ